MIERKMKYLRIIRILKEEIDNLYRLFGENEKYAKLLQILKDYPEYEHPTQKELIKKLQLQRPALMKLLNELYSDSGYKIIDEDAYQGSKSEILIIAKLKDKSRELVVRGLESIPSVGEEFNIYFINECFLQGNRRKAHFNWRYS